VGLAICARADDRHGAGPAVAIAAAFFCAHAPGEPEEIEQRRGEGNVLQADAIAIDRNRQLGFKLLCHGIGRNNG